MNETSKPKIDLGSLTAAKTVMICAILICAGIAAYLGANVSTSFTFEGRLYDVERALWVPVNSTVSALGKPVSYLIDVYPGTTKYYLQWNGTTGKLDDYSINGSAIVNHAIGNLTTGRKHKETIMLKNNITVNAPIIMRNYTVLLINGKITLADGANCNIIETLADTQQIEIVGGLIDGNKWNNLVYGYGIYMRGWTVYERVSQDWGDPFNQIIGVSLVNCRNASIWQDSRKTLVWKCNSYASGGAGFVDGGTDNFYVDCESKSAGGNGFTCSGPWSTFLRCVADHCNVGFEITTHHVDLIGGYSEYNTGTGVYAMGWLANYYIHDNKIEGMEIINNNGPGITFYNVTYTIVSSCHFLDDQTPTTQTSPWSEFWYSDYNTYILNHIENSGTPIFIGLHNIIEQNNGYNDNRLRGILGVAGGNVAWDISPSDMANATDCSFTYATGTGSNDLPGAATIGDIVWDLGAIYNVQIFGVLTFGGNNMPAGSTGELLIQFSEDGASWYNSAPGFGKVGACWISNSTQSLALGPLFAHTRYVLIYWIAGAAGNWTGSVVELEALLMQT